MSLKNYINIVFLKKLLYLFFIKKNYKIQKSLKQFFSVIGTMKKLIVYTLKMYVEKSNKHTYDATLNNYMQLLTHK